VSDKDRKEFARDLKRIYTAPNEKAGYDQMLEVSEKWRRNTGSYEELEEQLGCYLSIF